MAEHKTRLVAYAPNGAKLGPLPWPLEFSATVQTGELGAASLTYSRAAVGGGLLRRTLTQGLEVALEEWDGAAWVEPAGGRFIAIERSFDPSDRTDTVSLTCPAYGWMLTKVKHAAPSEALYSSAEGENQGRRQFLGVNAGTVIKTLRDEYAARGGYAINLGFDTALDSNGNPWPSLNAFWISRGEALDVTLARLYDGGAVDWWWQGRTLRMAPPSAGRERGSVVILRAGREIAEAASTETIADLISAQTLHGGDGVLVTTTEPTAPTPWGRWEGFASDDRVTLAASATARNQQVLAEAGRLRGQYTRDLTPLNPHRLGIDILPGDWIAATTTSTAATERVRIASLLWRAGSQGVTRSLILNDSLLDSELRRQRRDRLKDGGSNGAGTTVTPVADGADRRTPAQVTGLAVTTTAYIDRDGAPQGLISATWNPVTTARPEDGSTALEVSGYELAIRRNVAGAPWTIVRSTEATSAEHAPLTPGDSIQVRVRAIGRYTTSPGVWSATTTILVASDTTPPPVPSAPILTGRLGVLQVEWNGLAAGGGSGISTDFARVEVAVGTTSTPTTVRGTILRAGGMAHITGLAYGTAHWVRLRSVDRSGNASSWSTAVSITLLQVVDTDLASTAGMADKIAGIIGTFGTTITNWLQAGHIEAGSFNGYVIKGADIISETPGDPLNTIRLNDRTLTVNRDDGEGGSLVTVQLGGSVADQLILRDTTGGTKALLDAGTGNGSVSGQFSVGSLIVGGDSLPEILMSLPQGVVAYCEARSSSATIAGSVTDLMAVSAQIYAGRRYRIRFGCYVQSGTTGQQIQFRLFWKTTSGITNGTYTELLNSRVVPTVAGSTYMEFVTDWTATGTFPAAHFLVAAHNTSGSSTFTIYAGGSFPAQFSMEDIGFPKSNGSIVWPTAPATPPVQTYTKEYTAAWTRSWRGGSIVTDFLHHGYYGGYQRYSMVGFGGTIASDLSGASISKVEAYLNNEHWWANAGGTVLVGSTTNTSAPGSPVTTGTTANTAMAYGEARWVPVGGFSTASRAITLGTGAGTGTGTYGKFANAGVRLRVTYTR